MSQTYKRSDLQKLKRKQEYVTSAYGPRKRNFSTSRVLNLSEASPITGLSNPLDTLSPASKHTQSISIIDGCNGMGFSEIITES